MSRVLGKNFTSRQSWEQWKHFITWNSSMFELPGVFIRCSRRGYISGLSASRANHLSSIPSSISSSPNDIYSNTRISRSLEARATPQVRGREILCIIQTLSTTASLYYTHTTLRHLEYISSGQSLRGRVRAIKEIYHLGPRLRSLRFMWGAGRTETFLDVTKFFHIATNTPLIKHIYLSDISGNVSDFHQASPIFAIYT